jgi:hypothetical protein
MGLAERRGVERFQNEQYPDWVAKIGEAAGFDLPVEVVWEELAVPDYADSYPEFFVKVFFQPLVDALSAITIDDLGKTAVRSGLRKIVIRNSGQHASASGCMLLDKVLTFDHRPEANVDYGAERAKDLQRILENGL